VSIEGLADRLLAVVAMLLSIRPLLAGALGQRSHLSWKRGLALLAGGLAGLVALIGLLVVRAWLAGGTIYLPTWLGGTLAVFGGMLGVATLMAGRAEGGLSEDAAIRGATLAVAMVAYVAAPRLSLLALGLTRGLRASLPWTVSQRRWLGVLEGLVLLALVFVSRDPDLGGLRLAAAQLGAL
jgi:hypothetical protein